ncbi:MAG: 30S ribosomal protein S20 [Candidatus Hydrogenedentota bacterium]|mgnify:CR=1 FL=1|uniref:Small ribosomal subunit protein bS20 n=1 Tax=Sumerlaea chitinivorans TaxID=2250252 RepID=A0A2Z4Y4P1_SUMC1|nr:SSU ribosomal protein S20p [Candidatus Sumerlaea chitinivorans]RMH29590.1 MAG: 30S ribosomal protein S20 [Candidatus Hydrogenedentota bacterium]
MPNKKSAKKRVKQNKRNELRNRAAKSAMKTAIKKTLTLLTVGEKEAAVEKCRETQALIARTWKRGIIHKNKARRLQSRLMKKVARAQG